MVSNGCFCVEWSSVISGTTAAALQAGTPQVSNKYDFNFLFTRFAKYGFSFYFYKIPTFKFWSYTFVFIQF